MKDSTLIDDAFEDFEFSGHQVKLFAVEPNNELFYILLKNGDSFAYPVLNRDASRFRDWLLEHNAVEFVYPARNDEN